MLTLHFNIVDSTNILAKQLLASYDDVIVTADQQTHGKGRNGKSWNAGIARDILFTHGMKVKGYREQEPLIMQACAALAVQAFLLEILPESAVVKIKYPNDVHVKYQERMGKISGSLIETEYSGNILHTIITGIGININSSSDELAINQPTISVCDIIGKDLDLTIARKSFIDHFMRTMSEKQTIIDRWIEQLDLPKKTIIIPGELVEYQVYEILHDGRLRCKSGEKERIIHSGDSIRYKLFD